VQPPGGGGDGSASPDTQMEGGDEGSDDPRSRMRRRLAAVGVEVRPPRAPGVMTRCHGKT